MALKMASFYQIISSKCLRCFHEENYQIDVRDCFYYDRRYSCTFHF